MINVRQPHKLDEWLRYASESGITGLRNFAASLNRDHAAANARPIAVLEQWLDRELGAPTEVVKARDVRPGQV